jgi:general secretion pathway protein G
MKIRFGFTLVELVIVVAILGIVGTIVAGTLNGLGIQGKGQDARRKKDIARIRVALEEYYNDNKCYPTGDFVNTYLMNPDSCNKKVDQFPQLSPWICDPYTKTPYLLAVTGDNCPRSYKIFTMLSTPNASGSIASSSTNVCTYGFANGLRYSGLSLNYGVSSDGAEAWDKKYSMLDKCQGGCRSHQLSDVDNSCNAAASCNGSGEVCYLGVCDPECRVASCSGNTVVSYCEE